MLTLVAPHCALGDYLKLVQILARALGGQVAKNPSAIFTLKGANLPRPQSCWQPEHAAACAVKQTAGRPCQASCNALFGGHAADAAVLVCGGYILHTSFNAERLRMARPAAMMRSRGCACAAGSDRGRVLPGHSKGLGLVIPGPALETIGEPWRSGRYCFCAGLAAAMGR